MPNPISITPLSNVASIQESNLKETSAVETTSNSNPHYSERSPKETGTNQERQLQSKQEPTNNPENTALSRVFRILGNADEFKILSSGTTAYLVHSSGRIISLSTGIDREHLQFDNGRSNISGALKNPIGEFLEQKRQEAIENKAAQNLADTDSEHNAKDVKISQEEELVRYTRRGEKEENKDKSPNLVNHYEDVESDDQHDTSNQYQANGKISKVIVDNGASYSATEDSDGLKQLKDNIISEQA